MQSVGHDALAHRQTFWGEGEAQSPFVEARAAAGDGSPRPCSRRRP
jgi:hypothetical protein